jgi:predicted RND superfamily exporter protein
MAVFVLSLLLVPILFSFQGDPKERHLGALGSQVGGPQTEGWSISYSISAHGLCCHGRAPVIGLIGVSRLKNETHVVDDLPADDPVMQDLQVLRGTFNGVMPLEVMVDTRKKGQVLKDMQP